MIITAVIEKRKIISEMKKLHIGILSAIVLMGLASCKKYLDINTNPNSATTSTPELVLSQALTGTANVVNGYNSMGAQLVGYMANAGGYGGFGSAVTYNFGNGDFQGNWNNAYDNLADYQYIIDQTAGNGDYVYYNAIAKIMKAYEFQLLVDTYNDVPYTEAFKGKANFTPKYDDAKVVYDSIYALLENANSLIEAGQDGSASGNVQKPSANDVVFKGDMNSWKRFANTVMLRIAIRGKSGGLTFDNKYAKVTGGNFLTADVMVNPGYQMANGKQNPEWNTWAYSYTDAVANRAWMASKFIVAFYNGNKLSDDYRGYPIFNGFPSVLTNQLGYENTSVASAPSAGSWVEPYEDKANNVGVLKGPAAGMPLLTLSEADFLQAEAALKGGFGVSGDPKTYFENGILANLKYLYTKSDGTDVVATDNWWAGKTEADLLDAYKSDNATSYLVNFDLAETDAQKLEAIITQQYISLNMINSDQAWNDFRRTGYPAIVDGSTNGVLSFASLQSISTRPDKLISRILYPTSELSYNNKNLPQGITVFGSKIFWDPN